MEEQEVETGRIPTWRHLNDEIRLKGLSGTQLVAGILIFFLSFSLGIEMVPVVVIIELVLYKWYTSLIIDDDPNPIVTRNVKNASSHFVQDKTGFYDQLITREDEK